tara:strand:- start:73 stop:318 length:246 start_codon:yes stop_codon:yes gene_type:complete
MSSQQSTLSTSQKTRSDWKYTIEKSRFGLFTSVLTDGTKMVTGSTEDGVRIVTDDVHIPVMKGEFNGWTSQARSSVVEGKL